MRDDARTQPRLLGALGKAPRLVGPARDQQPQPRLLGALRRSSSASDARRGAQERASDPTRRGAEEQQALSSKPGFRGLVSETLM